MRDLLIEDAPNGAYLLRTGYKSGVAMASPLLILVVRLGGDVLCIRTGPRMGYPYNLGI